MSFAKKERVRQAFSNLLSLMKDLHGYISEPSTNFPIILDSNVVQALGLSIPPSDKSHQNKTKTPTFQLESPQACLDILFSCLSFSQKILKHASSFVADMISLELAPLQFSVLNILLSRNDLFSVLQDKEHLIVAALQVWITCLNDEYEPRALVRKLAENHQMTMSQTTAALLRSPLSMTHADFQSALTQHIRYIRLHCAFLHSNLLPSCESSIVEVISRDMTSPLSMELFQLYLSCCSSSTTFPLTPKRISFILETVFENEFQYIHFFMNWVPLIGDSIFVSDRGEIQSRLEFVDDFLVPYFDRQCHQQASKLRKNDESSLIFWCQNSLILHTLICLEATEAAKNVLHRITLERRDDLFAVGMLSSMSASNGVLPLLFPFLITDITYIFMETNLSFSDTDMTALLIQSLSTSSPVFIPLLINLLKCNQDENRLEWLRELLERLLKIKCNEMLFSLAAILILVDKLDTARNPHQRYILILEVYIQFFSTFWKGVGKVHMDGNAHLVHLSKKATLYHRIQSRSDHKVPSGFFNAVAYRNVLNSFFSSCGAENLQTSNPHDRLFYEGVCVLYNELSCGQAGTLFSKLLLSLRQTVDTGSGNTDDHSILLKCSMLKALFSICTRMEYEESSDHLALVREHTAQLVYTFLQESVSFTPNAFQQGLVNLFDLLNFMILEAQDELLLYLLLLYFDLMSFSSSISTTSMSNLSSSQPIMNHHTINSSQPPTNTNEPVLRFSNPLSLSHLGSPSIQARQQLYDQQMMSADLPSHLSLSLGYHKLCQTAMQRFREKQDSKEIHQREAIKMLLMPWRQDLAYHLLMTSFKQQQSLSDTQLTSTAPYMLKELAAYLDMSLNRLLRKSLGFILPRMVARQNQQVMLFLAHTLGTDTMSLLIEHLHDIFCYLFIELDASKLGNAMLALQSHVTLETGIKNDGDEGGLHLTIKDLIKSCAMSLVNKLAHELGDTQEQKQQRALRAIVYVANTVQNEDPLTHSSSTATNNNNNNTMFFPLTNTHMTHGSTGIQSNALLSSKAKESLNVFLKHHFLGILHSINEILLNKHESIAMTRFDEEDRSAPVSSSSSSFSRPHRSSFETKVRQKAARSLVEIIKLMGNDVYTMHAQITATLQLMTADAQLRIIAFHAWDNLIKSLEIAKVGPLLCGMVVSLLRLYDVSSPPSSVALQEEESSSEGTFVSTSLSSLQQDILQLLQFLLIDHRRVLGRHFDELFFLPDTLPFQHLQRVLKEVVSANMSTTQSATQIVSDELMRRHTLSYLVKALKNENDLIVFYSLMKLRQMLIQHQHWFHELVLGEQVDGLVADMLKALLLNSHRFNNPTHRIGVSGSAPLNSEPHQQPQPSYHQDHKNNSDCDLVQTQLLVAECLGLLGAIDPGRLDAHEVQGNLSVVVVDIGHRHVAIEFACALIADHLVPILRATNDTKTQNKAAFAIQELLKFCEFPADVHSPQQHPAIHGHHTKRGSHRGNSTNSSHTENTFAHASLSSSSSSSTAMVSPFPYKYHGNIRDTWLSFPRHVHETIQPLLQARYTMSYADHASRVTGTVFESSASYHEWLSGWTKELMMGITDDHFGPILKACRGIVRSHSSLALYLLPFLVLHWLKHHDSSETLFQECMAVLSKDTHRVSTSHQQQQQHQESHDMGQLCTQTVFTLLDQITLWTLQQKKTWTRLRQEGGMHAPMATTNPSIQGASLQDPQTSSLIKIEAFVHRVPHRLLADASYRYKAYARALMHLEQYVREEMRMQPHGTAATAAVSSSSSVSSSSMLLLSSSAELMKEGKERGSAAFASSTLAPHLEHMQKIYAQLDEPDGLDGIARLLLFPSLDAQILEHEACGRWTAAQTCYELALKQHPNDLRYHLGLMQCLRQLGHLETLAIHTRGLTERGQKDSEHVSSCADIHALGIEAAWRLSDWKSLRELVHPQNDKITLSDTHLKASSEYEHPSLFILSKDDTSRAADKLGSIVSPQRVSLGLSTSSYEELQGRMLLAWHDGDDVAFYACLKSARRQLMTPLAAASMESYRRAYPLVVQLHLLAETERMYVEVKEADHARSLSWESRLRITQSSFRVREGILNLRRVLLLLKQKEGHVQAGEEELNIAGNKSIILHGKTLDKWLGNVYLQSAKAARQEGHFASAYHAILHAEAHGAGKAGLERARWCWYRGEHEKALVELQKVYDVQTRTLQSMPSPESAEGAVVNEIDVDSPKYLHAKTTLLLGRWMEETGHSKSTDVLAKYLEVISLQKRWAKGYYYLGRYQNKLFENEMVGAKNILSPLANSTAASITPAHLTYVAHTVRNFARSLLCSTKYLYQTLPKLLTLWLDYGAMISVNGDNHSGTLSRELETLQNMEGVIDTLTHRAPALVFLTAFPQIVSRICHRNDRVFERLETIIIKVLKVYPQQALWQLVGVSKSTFPMRSRRCNEIFTKLKNTAPGLRELVNEATSLTDQLLALCNYPVPADVATLSIVQEFRTLQRMTPLQVMMPLQSSLTPTLPVNGGLLANDSDYEPFGKSLVTIHSFCDEVEVISSLQRPRKISIIGSDGRTYTFLCKPKDDLRKDARMMEFNSLINKLLKQDPETRKRSLYIRTYAVVPINEECGIIEWVPHTVGFRHILLKLYKDYNMTVSIKEIKMLIRQKKPLKTIFLEDLLPRFPSIFHVWFIETFAEPTTWFTSRLAYARTSAVISIIGFILGLGDRHGENILFDERNGDCVHVDFNCLFDKGLTFEKPEKVPFRLTHNMIDALGITGYEGVFRKSCEVTLRLLRTHRDSLVSVLEAFVHDPLVEWSKGRQLSKTGEMENEKALKCLSTIDRKITGILKSPMPLSVEGQVQELILQATSDDNLSEMYIGWAAYM